MWYPCTSLHCRDTSSTKKRTLLGPYSRPLALRWTRGGGGVLMSEVPLHPSSATSASNVNIRRTGVPHLQENATFPGPYRRPMPGVIRSSHGVARFLIGEVHLYPVSVMPPLGFEPQGSLGELVGSHRDAPLQSQLSLVRGWGSDCVGYRVSSLTRKRNSLGPYRRPMPGVLEGS